MAIPRKAFLGDICGDWLFTPAILLIQLLSHTCSPYRVAHTVATNHGFSVGLPDRIPLSLLLQILLDLIFKEYVTLSLPTFTGTFLFSFYCDGNCFRYFCTWVE